MSVIDHGSWLPYKPETLPEGAPPNALFAQRESDFVDWYVYVNSGENFGEANVKMMASLREEIGYVVGPAVYDPTMLFPAKHIVMEVTDYGGTDPQKDFGGKVYDPATMTFSDPPPTPPLPQYQVLYDHEVRLREIEGAPAITMSEFMSNKLRFRP